MNYYNENCREAAEWLRELMKSKLIPDGTVDERSITDVCAGDLAGFIQCHFFAGIGGWPFALRLAGWPDSKPVWTMSCPCQPFSCAGKGMGIDDERHLWPFARNLVGQCQPPIVFGEQVASAAGREWFNGVSADLEKLAYASTAADLCAAGIGAPHIRQRLYWVAQPASKQWIERCGIAGSVTRPTNSDTSVSGGSRRLADDQGEGRSGMESEHETGKRERSRIGSSGADCWMGEPIQQGLEGQSGNGDNGNKSGRIDTQSHGSIAETGSNGGVGDTECERQRRRDERRSGAGGEQMAQQENRTDSTDQSSYRRKDADPWGNYDLIPCRDGKSRRVESGTFPLAHGVPGRVGLLRGYGNAIVPQLAAEFIQAVMESKS